MFIFKWLHPQGGDRVAAPPRSCKSETPRGEVELGEIASKPPSSLLHTSAGATNLIYCYKLLLSNRPNTRYNLPPRQKSRTEPKSNSSCQPGTPTKLLGHHGNEELCALHSVVYLSRVSNLLKPVKSSEIPSSSSSSFSSQECCSLVS